MPATVCRTTAPPRARTRKRRSASTALVDFSELHASARAACCPMRVTIHQPEHLPWLGFLDKARRADLLVLLDSVQYRKNYFQNRNRVRAANGPAWVTVPVLTKGNADQEIREVQINTEGSPRWREKYWGTIEQSYRGAPFWNDYSVALREA